MALLQLTVFPSTGGVGNLGSLRTVQTLTMCCRPFMKEQKPCGSVRYGFRHSRMKNMIEKLIGGAIAHTKALCNQSTENRVFWLSLFCNSQGATIINHSYETQLNAKQPSICNSHYNTTMNTVCRQCAASMNIMILLCQQQL